MFIKSLSLNLSKNFNFCFFANSSLLFLKGTMGIVFFKLPSFYFFKYSRNILSFIFLNNFYFSSFIKHFSYLYKRLFNLYFVKFRIKGLGYRFRKINNSLYRFFFNFTNFFYFHIPSNILIKSKRKRIILLSNDLSILKMVLAHLLLLKKFTIYRMRGLLYPRQIIFLRIGKKNL